MIKLPEPDDNFPDLDVLGAYMQKATKAYNHNPNPEIGGFSPDMLFRLKHNEWNTPECPLKLNTNLPLETLSAASEFVRLRKLLKAVADMEGGAKATARGNFSRKVVEDVVNIFWTPEEKQNHLKYSKVTNEADVAGLLSGRHILELAGLLKKRKGLFYVPKAKQFMLEEKHAGELCEILFKTHLRKFNLGFVTRFPDAFDVIQHDVDYCLFTLEKHAKNWARVADLPKKLLHPITLATLLSALDGQRFINVAWLLDSYILRPFESWGLLEFKQEEGDVLGEMKKVQVTPFYYKWITFKEIEGGG